MLTRDLADHFAAEWVAAWNSHDLARILAHYAPDFEMASPLIAKLAGEPSGVLRGHAAVGAYWRAALARTPELHFTLLSVFVSAHSVALHYEGVRGPVIEVFEFNADGLVQRAAAHY